MKGSFVGDVSVSVSVLLPWARMRMTVLLVHLLLLYCVWSRTSNEDKKRSRGRRRA